jgi:chromosome segregation ATPase
LTTELRSVEEQQREFERELAQVERDLGEKSNKRKQVDEHIRRVNEQKANRVKVFGTQMPDIIALINKNKEKFSVAPIGPLGLRMSLKDNAWSTAIESATAASLVCRLLFSTRTRPY